MSYITSRKAVERLGLHPNTLRRYGDNGTIPTIRNLGGQRLYDVDAYLRVVENSTTICYCRVSSAKQRDDLERQVAKMREQFPNAEIVKDIGSGLNFKRKGLQTILGRLMRGDKLKVCIVHRDRLARFGIDLFKYLVELNGGELVVLDPYVESSKEAELTSDLLAILHHFSCRMHGSRSHKGKEDKDISNCNAENDIPSMVRDFEESLQRNSNSLESTEGNETGTLDGSV